MNCQAVIPFCSLHLALPQLTDHFTTFRFTTLPFYHFTSHLTFPLSISYYLIISFTPSRRPAQTTRNPPPTHNPQPTTHNTTPSHPPPTTLETVSSQRPDRVPPYSLALLHLLPGIHSPPLRLSLSLFWCGHFFCLVNQTRRLHPATPLSPPKANLQSKSAATQPALPVIIHTYHPSIPFCRALWASLRATTDPPPASETFPPCPNQQQQQRDMNLRTG